MIEIANARRPVTRYKQAWSDAWTDLVRGSYEIGPVTRGLSSAFGSASMTTYRTSAVNREADAPAEPALAEDMFVQVGAEDLELAEDATDRIRWLWLGIITDHKYQHDGTETAGTEQSLIVRRSWSLEGLASIFQRITLARSLVRGHTGATVTLERPLVFNRDGRPNRDPTIDGTIYPFRLQADATAAFWTARQALEHILFLHATTSRLPRMPTFQLTGQVELLDYTDTFDVGGQRLAEILTALCGGVRGGSWSIEPADSGTGVVPIRITASLTAPVNIAAAGDVPAVSLPACDRLIERIATGASHRTVVSSISSRARAWTLAGTARTTLTLAFRPAAPTAYDGLARGWAAADDGTAGSTDARYVDVYRRFVLDPTWSGLVSSNAGLANTVDRDGSGYNGGLISGGVAPILAATFDPDLVIAERGTSAAGLPLSLASWSSDSAAKNPGKLPVDQVRVYLANTGSNPVEITDDFEIRVTNDPVPAVIIGRDQDDAARLKTLMGTSGSRVLYVTLTVIDPAPVLVSREPALAAVDQRIATDHQVHTVLSGTVLGISAGAALITMPATRIVRDDRPRMRALLAQLGPYLDRAGSATITDRLHLLAPADCLPGSLVRAYDDGRAIDIDLRALITSVTWNFERGSYGTTINLEPPTLDLRAYL